MLMWYFYLVPSMENFFTGKQIFEENTFFFFFSRICRCFVKDKNFVVPWHDFAYNFMLKILFLFWGLEIISF